MTLASKSMCRVCGKQRTEAELIRIGHSVVICRPCVAEPVMASPAVNDSGSHACVVCHGPFDARIVTDADNRGETTLEEIVYEIHENGKRWECCTACYFEWERKNFHLIAGTQYAAEHYA